MPAAPAPDPHRCARVFEEISPEEAFFPAASDSLKSWMALGIPASLTDRGIRRSDTMATCCTLRQWLQADGRARSV
jgi:hypothetical protein